MKTGTQFRNKVEVEGYVYSIKGKNEFDDLKERITGPASKNPNTKYIAGDLNIAVDEAGMNIVTIHYSYVTETTAKGQPNRTYAVLKRLIENPDRTWLSGGKEKAFMVSCSGAAINVNDFIAQDGSKVASLRNENGFCSIVNELKDEGERAKFETDFLITKVTSIEEDEEKGIMEPYVTISGAIFGYGPKLIPATFVVRNKSGMKYFENLDITPSTPVFTQVRGIVNCRTIKIKKVLESSFEEDYVTTYDRKVKEYLVTWAAKVPYDFGDEEVLTIADVTKFNQDRQIALAEVEKRHKERQNKKVDTFSDAGGGNKNPSTDEILNMLNF